MKRLTFVLVTTLLVVGAIAMLPQAVSAQVRVLSLTKTLPADGTDVTFTLNAVGLFGDVGDLVVMEILTDNHPTDAAGQCTNTGGDPVTCTDSDFRLVSLKIDGKPFRPGEQPSTIADNDKLAIRPLLDREFSDVRIPLDRGSQLVLTFDTQNGQNDVTIKVTIGFLGGALATFQ